MDNTMKIGLGIVGGFVLGLLVMFGYQRTVANTLVPQTEVMTPASTSTPSVSETPSEVMTSEWKIPLLEQNKSGESGTVTLVDMKNGQTKVIIDLTMAPGASAAASQPAHIHAGACPTPGAVKFPLTNVVNGKSETVIATSVAGLKAMLPLAVNVHKSANEIAVYTACGDLK